MRRPTILHADAHADTRDLLVWLLAPYDLDVIGVGDGDAAYEAAVRRVPQVIVSELALPVSSGIELARKVRATPGLQHLTMIAWTGRADARGRAEAMAAGFSGVVVKALDPDIVPSVLEALGICVSGSNRQGPQSG
jgi:CheY-like chemotaxis protein